MRYPMFYRLGPAAISTLLLTAGCATGRSALTDATPEPAPSLRAQSAKRGPVMEQAEIRSVETGYTALDAVRRLRPEFLARHATPRPGEADEGFAVV